MKRNAQDLQHIAQLMGRVIQKKRKRGGMNQTELAPLLRLDQSALSRVESGNQQLTLAQWIILTQTLHVGCDPGKLVARYFRLRAYCRRKALKTQKKR